MTNAEADGSAVVDLHEIRRDMGGLVGGKAGNLGEMAAAGEQVPPGFCVTTAAYVAGEVPADAIVSAYERMGGGPVAVRSSATAEDLPDASFAGQQDTYLNIEGAEAVADAVRRCWDSLDNERAVAYRDANTIDRADVRMAVIVQRMVDADTAGVLFTADPVTGTRTRTVVDAVRGLGTAVVDGSTEPDHYALDEGAAPDDTEGCLTTAQLEELRSAGRRLQDLFDAPQDVEWARDADGVLWLLQARPITTLFPLPPQNLPDLPRLYLEAGHIQGMLRPFTPMGMAMMQEVWSRWCKTAGITVDPHDPDGLMAGIGGRLYIDISSFVRSKPMRRRLAAGLDVYGPRVQEAVTRMLRDPRFAPRPGLPFSVRTAFSLSVSLLPGFLAGIGWSLARPDSGRAKALSAVESLRRLQGPGDGAAARERLDWITGSAFDTMLGTAITEVIGPVFAGILAGTAPASLLKGIASKQETDIVLGGMPHNVTTEMNLALWRIAERARPHGALFTDTSPDELAERYRRGELPDVGIDAFLDNYGHRAAAEVDIGVPRWREDPSPVFGAVANYLRLQDPEQAPDRRFEQAAAAAETKLEELSARAVRARPVRGRVAAFLMRRSRSLTGMREYAKFAWLVPYAEMRRQLVLAGADLVAAGVLEASEDIMFLEPDEVRAAIRDHADRRALVAERRRLHAREVRRRSVPGALLTDGTDIEATAPTAAPEDGFTGMPAAPGRAEGRARVVVDPAGAHVEPGEILVAPTTDPGWTPLFMTAAGLVSDTGSPIAHGPTVAREYGIPAVICVRDATTAIRTGDLLRIDGAAGTVEIVPDPDTEPGRVRDAAA
ncbi:pyruvate,water dikinase [Halopolyspora algeriensis]|uniref:Pyruvate,water dikinase n=1 Tax=Halopolyspora algeriensis TaxID=1500506 RepID=A0A368VHF1_9ACTN|nr:PEP/pyruvate-binding domain-containing protein [Halopolyspora algeriensis]RCW39625.1 pyruvate,water dikinase [Halopolyspora algeriensis]TQM54081.1 pyruvate,water dikinase [Halopolyspora algeriensis]